MSDIQGVMKLDEFYSGRDEAGRSVSQRRLQEDAGENCKKMQRICRNVAEKFSGLAPRFGG